jgi:hypothetical protein
MPTAHSPAAKFEDDLLLILNGRRTMHQNVSIPSGGERETVSTIEEHASIVRGWSAK